MLLACAIVVPTLVGLLAVHMEADLGFDDRGLGLAIAVFWAVTAIGAPLAGRAADLFGWPLVARLGAMVTTLALLGLSLAVSGLGGLVVMMAVAGLGYCLCSPTSNLLVVDAVESGRRASALGLKQTAPPVLMTLYGVATPWLVAHVGWRMALAVGVLPSLAVLVGVPALVRRRAAVDAVSHEQAAPGSLRPASRSRDRPPVRPLRLAPVVVVAGLGTFSVATVTGFSVLTLVQVGLEASSAALVVSIGSAIAIAARLILGGFLDSRPLEDLSPLRFVMAAASLSLSLVSLGLFVVAGAGPQSWAQVLVASGVLASLVTAWTWPALLLVSLVRRSARPGADSGLLQVGSGIGSCVGPLLFGLISASGGRAWAWLLMAACTALAWLLVRHASDERGPTKA